MPMASALTFASALTLTLQFLIFAYLYSFHRARFFHYLLLAWGLMSLAKGLHLAPGLRSGPRCPERADQCHLLRRHAPGAGRRPGLSHRLPDRAEGRADRRAGGVGRRRDRRSLRRDRRRAELRGGARSERGGGDHRRNPHRGRAAVLAPAGAVAGLPGTPIPGGGAHAVGTAPHGVAVHRRRARDGSARDDARRVHGLLLPLHLRDHHRGAGPGPQRDRHAQGIQRAAGGRPRRGPPARRRRLPDPPRQPVDARAARRDLPTVAATRWWAPARSPVPAVRSSAVRRWARRSASRWAARTGGASR